MRTPSFAGFVLLAVVGLGCLAPASASAQFPDPDKLRLEWNGRLLLGFGSTLGELHREFIFDNQTQFDLVWGKPGNHKFRFGIAANFRTASFKTLEGAGGATLLIPTWAGYPIVLTGFGGYAFRKDEFGGNGLFGGAMLEWGYRPYNHHGRFQMQVSPFVQSRIHRGGGFEMIAGVSIDFALVATPFIFLANWAARRGDPDEPEEPEDPEERPDRSNAGPRASAPAPASTPVEPAPTEPAPVEPAPVASESTEPAGPAPTTP